MLVISQIFALVQLVALGLSTRAKTSKSFYQLQAADCALGILSNIFLGALGGSLSLVASLTRNLLKASNKLTPLLGWVLVAAQLVLGIVASYHGRLGIWELIPIVATVSYSISMIMTSDLRLTKIAMVGNLVLWGIYNFLSGNYVACISGIIFTISTLHSLRKEHHG